MRQIYLAAMLTNRCESEEKIVEVEKRLEVILGWPASFVVCFSACSAVDVEVSVRATCFRAASGNVPNGDVSGTWRVTKIS